MADPGRRYSEREMALILRLATELEKAPPTATPAGTSGRTLADIERIAAEAGIAPGAIREAARSLEAEDAGALSRLLGAPTLFRYERLVPGELNEGETLDLIRSLRWSLNRDGGEAVGLPDAVGWRHKPDEGPLTHFEVTRRGGYTRLRLLGDYKDPAAWVLIGAGAATAMTSGLAIAVVEPALQGALALIGTAGGVAWLGARRFWQGISRRVGRRYAGAMERLETEARTLSPADPAKPSIGSGADPIN